MTQMRIQATFVVDVWDGTDDDQVDGGPVTGRVELTKTYTEGDVKGSATGHMVTTQGPGGAAYVAQERVTGIMGGRTGTFVLEHRATQVPGTDPVTWAGIVPGSGTGELAGVSGEGSLGHGTLDLQVEFATDGAA
ncbi:hypothetical protein CG723_27405 [Streptomyces sp. CB01635]|uniref:DUF3224 domain-containing protein n=1 Tax=unclassified Streptomyces TaxID=2593676 RepID=UPI000C271DCF|nr:MULTISPECIES: DUF3224 domain-containing protein [unclassified Streptomyces]PJN08512.1 hypothetical protein CG723_27405 [Streptomyces sp. CB01635]WSE11715.1 DUF3224 domain-containing protein [Streptomyces sp. NBC_01445]